MHIGRHIVQQLVFEFGEPVIERWDVPLSEPELLEVERHRQRGRAHDVSLLIRDGDAVAVIRKTGYPENVYRIPSGGIHPEESFVDGATREAHEETGLTVSMEDYLLQLHAHFTCGDRRLDWITHVMLAHSEAGTIAPLDTSEVEAARWIDWSEFIRDINPLLEKSELGGLRYRARIHARCAELLEERESRGRETR